MVVRYAPFRRSQTIAAGLSGPKWLSFSPFFASLNRRNRLLVQLIIWDYTNQLTTILFRPLPQCPVKGAER